MTESERSILIYEPQASSLKRLVTCAEQLGYRAVGTTTTEQATTALNDVSYQALLLAATPQGIELGRYVRTFTPLPAPIAAVVGADDPQTPDLVRQMQADGFLRRPVGSTTLETVLFLLGRIAEARRKIGELESATGELEIRLHRAGMTSARTGFHDFESVKDLLVVEVRRAKRYGYPLSILLVGLDPLPAADHAREQLPARDVTAGLAAAIAKSVRMIDLPIHFSDDRVLVFLPHTDVAGAEEVGRRIKRRIKRITYRGNGMTLQLTASVGIAGISAGDALTFAKLIRNAAAALKAAQLKGGDRVMKRAAKPTVAAATA